jgi:hypothetical protein
MVPVSLELSVTDVLDGNEPPGGDAVTVGATLSIVYNWVCIVPEFPAVSSAKYFRVVVVLIGIGEL